MKRLFVICLFFLLVGCAIPTARVEIFEIGGITFRLYERREDLTKEVEPRLSPMQQSILLLEKVVIGGYHDPKTRTIYTLKNVYTLLHELKHELEPGWNHALICGSDRCLDER